ncbi:hypothetical protein SAMN04487893_104187 [Myroides guanonis]|uniref:GIY-YIG domain-containing protein n=2 Tax=Myroides guanonis TaxID=1150112 RepID=A0A1I3PNV5_9FLAO|nr:hypothetical protein SAMN04487893_104187 [Myroides guanonis]
MLVNDLHDFDKLKITLLENRINSFIDMSTQQSMKSFHKRLVKKRIPKIYVIKENNEVLYVGTTVQSLTARFRYGLKADGSKGYHGYKWKNKECVDIYVWCFETLNKVKIENIEAELAFLIRTKTGKWPTYQNEIHFNNNYEQGKEIADKIFKIIE